jgi:hypothetical protein
MGSSAKLMVSAERIHATVVRKGLKEPRKGKFSDQYTGPYILEIQNVKIEIKGIPRTVHLNKLKLAHNRNR